MNARLAVSFNFSFFEMNQTHLTALSSIDPYSVCSSVGFHKQVNKECQLQHSF